MEHQVIFTENTTRIHYWTIQCSISAHNSLPIHSIPKQVSECFSARQLKHACFFGPGLVTLEMTLTQIEKQFLQGAIFCQYFFVHYDTDTWTKKK